MKYYFKVILMFIVIWTFAAALEWTTDFSVFECFVIFALSVLLSADLRKFLKELD